MPGQLVEVGSRWPNESVGPSSCLWIHGGTMTLRQWCGAPDDWSSIFARGESPETKSSLASVGSGAASRKVLTL